MTDTRNILSTDWKFLAAIRTNTIFESEIFNYKDCAIKICNYDEVKNKSLHLIELYTSKEIEPDIYVAFYKSIDLLNEFLDQLSFISFQSAQIIQPISISNVEVMKGEKFRMLHVHHSLMRKTIRFSSSEIIDYSSLNEPQRKFFDLLRILNYYQSSERIDEKFMHLYSVLDQIATIETDEYQTQKCSSCGKVNNLPLKATGNYIKKLIEDFKIKSLNHNHLKKIRGRIAHGSSKRDYSFFKDLSSNLPALESMVYSILSQKLPFKIKLNTNIHTSLPLFDINAICKKNI